VFYLLSGLGAAAAQVAVGPLSDIPMIGASGAVAGVLAAYLRFYPRALVFTLVPVWFAPILPIPAALFIVVWFGLQCWYGVGSVFATGMEGGVAWWAHIGGFVAGYYLAPILRGGAPGGRQRRR
jgi:membrane associated rhomboid family serine protease